MWSLHRELTCSRVKLHNHTCPCLCVSLCAASPQATTTSKRLSINSTIVTTWNHKDLIKWQKPAPVTVLFVIFKLFSFKWLGQEGNGHQSVNGPHASFEQLLCPSLPPLLFDKWVKLLMDEDLLLHPGLWVDGPVDDVKEDVRSGKHNPWVLVYSVGVYPNVHVASRWLNLACELRVIQCHLGQHSLLTAAVLWHPVIPRGVDIHRPVSSDLGVDHHLIGVANTTCARQLGRLEGNTKSFWHFDTCRV